MTIFKEIKFKLRNLKKKSKLRKSNKEPAHVKKVLITYATSEGLRRACASAQSRQSLRCSLPQ